MWSGLVNFTMHEDAEKSDEELPEILKEHNQGINQNKRFGEKYRESVMLSAPNILIGFPLAGAFLGWLLTKFLNWPIWVVPLVMMLGVIQGIREVIKLSKKSEGD